MWNFTWTSFLNQSATKHYQCESINVNRCVRQQANLWVCGRSAGCVLTMFAECFHTQRRFSSSLSRGKSPVAASESNWSESASDTWAVGPAELPLRKPVQKSSVLIDYSATCQHGFNHKLSPVAHGMLGDSYCSRIQHEGQCSSVYFVFKRWSNALHTF